MIKPINDNLTLVYEEMKEKVTESGIIVSGSAVDDKSKPLVALVASIGPDVKIGVVPGDTVLWDRRSKGQYTGISIVSQDSIIAVVTTDGD